MVKIFTEDAYLCYLLVDSHEVVVGDVDEVESRTDGDSAAVERA